MNLEAELLIIPAVPVSHPGLLESGGSPSFIVMPFFPPDWPCRVDFLSASICRDQARSSRTPTSRTVLLSLPSPPKEFIVFFLSFLATATN